MIGMAFFVAGCASSKGGAEYSANSGTEERNDPAKVESVVIDATRPPEKPTGITITDIRASGDTLLVDVTYSGGCKPHDFKLYSTGMWMKSMPPKVNVWLSHIAVEPDPCRQLMKENLKFIIKPLRYRGNEKVVVLMQGTALQTDYSYTKD